MALGGGGGQVALKQLAVNPSQVVIAREKEKIALQELNDRYTGKSHGQADHNNK
jgi:hypothetical protein